MGTRIVSNYLSVKYSIIAETPLLTAEQFLITPSILNYLGIILFGAGLIYLLLIMSIIGEKVRTKHNLLNIPFYLIFYLILYPFIMINAIWHFIRKKHIWR